jgi:predicted transcriptional regulator
MPKRMNTHSTQETIKLADIKETLRAEVTVGHDKLDMPVKTCTASDLMSDILRGPTDGALLVTGLNNVQAIRTSAIAGVAAVILVRDKRPDPQVINQAREHELPLLSTPFTMFSACGRLFAMGLRGVEIKPPSA